MGTCARVTERGGPMPNRRGLGGRAGALGGRCRAAGGAHWDQGPVAAAVARRYLRRVLGCVFAAARARRWRHLPACGSDRARSAWTRRCSRSACPRRNVSRCPRRWCPSRRSRCPCPSESRRRAATRRPTATPACDQGHTDPGPRASRGRRRARGRTHGPRRAGAHVRRRSDHRVRVRLGCDGRHRRDGAGPGGAPHRQRAPRTLPDHRSDRSPYALYMLGERLLGFPTVNFSTGRSPPGCGCDRDRRRRDRPRRGRRAAKGRECAAGR